jgi:hypothetical protein
MRRFRKHWGLLGAIAITTITAACSSQDGSVPASLRGTGGKNSVTIAVAGDICEAPGGQTEGCLQTSDLILSHGADWVLVAGDAQYNNGEIADFETVYEATWGRFKPQTLPVPGNHDQYDGGFSTYFANAGLGNPIPQHWIKDLGSWSVTGVDSNDIKDASNFIQDSLPTPDFDIVMWHHARYSSGTDHGSDDDMDPLWEAARVGGGCINFVSHDHIYERLTYEGMHQFLVGTGGGEQHDDFTEPDLVPGSEEVVTQEHAVLFMDLHESGTYEFELINVSDKVLDSGSGTCEA